MKAFEIIERLQLMHKLISEQRTGTPDDLAARLGIKRRTLYELIDEMKSREVPIAYSRTSKTFYYEKPVSIDVSFKVKPLTDEELTKKSAGFLSYTFPVHFLRTTQNYLSPCNSRNTRFI